jgi:hypothetical protein
MHKRLALVGIVAALAVPATSVYAASGHGHDGDRPETIDLPAGFVGEGVAVGAHNTWYAGSVADGRIGSGDLRDGTSNVFVSTPIVPAATGLKADQRHNLLWVSGAGTGMAAVYNLETGAPVMALTLTTAPSFINDVIVTRDAAYFTNSFAAEIYRVPVSDDGTVGTPETIALTGPAAEVVAGAFNLNGIEATSNGRTLIVVNSQTGKLFTVDPSTGDSALIDLGGASVPTGDGILLKGSTLYVMQNGNTPQPGVLNEIVVVKLRRHLSEGRVVDRITNPLFETATTMARRGDIIVTVNSQFGGAPIDPESELVLVNLDDEHGHGHND